MSTQLLSSVPPSEASSKPSPLLSATHLPMDLTEQQLALAEALTTAAGNKVEINGYDLSLANVVDTARRNREVGMANDGKIKERVDESVKFLKSKLVNSVYGVTTGFGGSADTRTDDPIALQLALLEHQLCGVLPSSFSPDDFAFGRGMENALPEEVVRGAMLVRVNSLSRGHSAVRMSVLETLIAFLNKGITPVVPLRGSISASGDLSPLSYIAGAITGHPDIKVIVRPPGSTTATVMLAPAALEAYGIPPVVLGPKEGLGLVNGTAVSASMASLVMNDAHFAVLLSQSVTAMTVEAMVGHVGSFHPFIHDVTRPHPGQIEVARNIRHLISESQFAVQKEEEVAIKADEGILRQDRYPLRTAAQWLGPLLSDLVGSHAIVQTELNATTDNPLIDVEGGMIHHGGNFQAMALTNAMEKTRLGVQQMGKLNFTQMTELVNGTMNRGLPSCLAAEDPSTSYHVKGLDIAAAAYTSELGFLANPVASHVQPAEMSNQAVNSLALISARKTLEALDVLSMLLSTHLYCVCQALDLRYIEFDFRAKFDPTLLSSLTASFSAFLTEDEMDVLANTLKKAIWRRLESTTSYDLVPRWADAFNHVSATVVDALATSSKAASANANPMKAVVDWKKASAENAVKLTREVRDAFFSASASPTVEYLGRTKALYSFVRDTLGVKARRGDVFLGKQETTVGSNVAKIYESVKTGRINEVLVGMMA